MVVRFGLVPGEALMDWGTLAAIIIGTAIATIVSSIVQAVVMALLLQRFEWLLGAKK